jgi:hypothetical protein
MLTGAVTALGCGADSILIVVATVRWLISFAALLIWNDLRVAREGGMRSMIPVLLDATLGRSWVLAGGWVLTDVPRLDEAAREGRRDLGAGTSDGARDMAGVPHCE